MICIGVSVSTKKVYQSHSFCCRFQRAIDPRQGYAEVNIRHMTVRAKKADKAAANELAKSGSEESDFKPFLGLGRLRLF